MTSRAIESAPAEPPGWSEGWRADGAPHLPGLDGLRALAVLLVIPHNLLVIEQPVGGWTRALLAWLERGWIGVTLFFALSGFLITGILLDTVGCANRLRVFYVRRALRIFPLYYAVLAVVLLVVPSLHWPPRAPHDSPQLWWSYWVYLSNWVSPSADTLLPSLPHVWSLAVEEQFYLLWPLLVYAVCGRWGVRHVRSLALLLFGASLGVRLAMVAAGQAPEAIYTATFSRMDALVLGGLAATVLRDPDLAGRWSLRGATWWSLAGLALVVAAGATQLRAYGAWQQTMGYSLLAVACVAAVAGVAVADLRGEAGIVARALRTPGLRRIGRYSYGMYLVHVPLGVLVGQPLLERLGYRVRPGDTGEWLTGLPLLAYLGAGVVLSFLVAMACWHAIEQPILRRKPAYRRVAADEGDVAQSPNR